MGNVSAPIVFSTGVWVTHIQSVLLYHGTGTITGNARGLKAPRLRRYGYGYMYVCKEVDMNSHLPKIFYIHNP